MVWTLSVLPARTAFAQIPKGSSEVQVTLLRSIGVEGDNVREEFGNVQALSVDDGRAVLFVLDRINGRLSVFSREGRFITATGRKGGGPGEFWWASSLAARGTSVRVYDSGHSRVSSYLFRGDSLGLTGDFLVPFQGSDMCQLNNEIFVLGYNRGRLVHRIGPDGKVAASFARPFRQDDALIAQWAADGRMVCDNPSKSLFVTSLVTPTVRRYGPSGQLLWEAAVPGGFVPTVITRRGHSVTFSRPKGKVHNVIVSLTVIPGGRLLRGGRTD